VVSVPAHFTHIYTARRVADYLASGQLPDWTGPAGGGEPVFTNTVGQYGPQYCGQIMQKWEKFTATGAIGPDLFYFSQDYASRFLGAGPVPPSDEIMLALAVYYFYKTNQEEDWEPLLVILDEVNSVLGALVRFLIKLFKIWKDFVAVWESTIGPFVTAASSALDDLTGGVVSEFSVAVRQLKTALITFVEEELVTFKDIFAAFDTCVAKGWDEQSFLWGDMTHYRRTTAVARSLVEQAEQIRVQDPEHPEKFEQLLAFAMGWLTHVGTDTIGHSFVNEQCGGPFRDHPQRHHLIENHIDAWNYRQAGPGGTIPPDPLAANATYPDITLSGLAFAVQMTPENPRGDQRPASLPDDPQAASDALKTDGSLPLWAADAIVKALIATYGPENPAPPARPTHPLVYQGSKFENLITENLLSQAILDVTGHGPDRPFQQLLDDIAPAPDFEVPVGYPLPWQVQGCYRLMITFYQLSYKGGWDLYKPRRPDLVIFPPSSDITNLTSPPDFTGPSSGDPIEDICNAIKALIEWITKELDAAVKLAGDLIKMLASPGSYPIRLALYQLAMLVWDVTQKLHELMAHTGFFLPHGEEHYPDGELRLGNEIDLPLITLGGTVDAAFQQLLGDALDPFGNLDHSTGLLVGHPIPDPRYPLYQVVEYHDDQGQPVPDRTPAGTADTKEYRRPWAYPDQSPESGGPNPSWPYTPTPTERPPLTYGAGPYPAGTTPPDVFFRTDAPVDPALRAGYENAQSPTETDRLNIAHLHPASDSPASPLGDPVPFSGYLIGRILNDRQYSTQFNLDSDRAYAYLTWDWIRGDATATEDLGFPYRAPLAWPQMAAGWADPGTEMQLEYIDQPPAGG
jgi:hypothetical protein